MNFYSSGKILLTGEYAVLDSAKALALPTVFGQYLSVLQHPKKTHIWKSINADAGIWFQVEFNTDFEIIHTSDVKKAEILLKILLQLKKHNHHLFSKPLQFITQLNFDKNWGLGSSSTLINNLAQWAQINPFDLLNNSFGGSGYDVAVAIENKALIYQILENKPTWKTLNIPWDFKSDLWFVYLNKKQNSRSGIKQYREKKISKKQIETISNITNQILNTNSLKPFKKLLLEHETLISNILQQKSIQQYLFSDFNGTIKSLGAWGGDFILATGTNVPEYFMKKGYKTIYNYTDFILD